MLASAGVFAAVIIVMAALCGAAVLAGVLVARAKERAFLKASEEITRGN